VLLTLDNHVIADKDVQNFEKLGGVDARQEHIKCPPDSVNAVWCSGY